MHDHGRNPYKYVVEIKQLTKQGIGAGEVADSVKMFSMQHEGPHLVPRTCIKKKKNSIAAYICNPSAWEMVDPWGWLAGYPRLFGEFQLKPMGDMS